MVEEHDSFTEYLKTACAMLFVLLLLALAMTLDYIDQKREACAQQNLSYSASLDICQKD